MAIRLWCFALCELTLLAQPAWACHRFKVWRYPWAQRCLVAHTAVASKEDRSWYVELVLPEPDPRERAIQQLREQLRFKP